MEGEGEGEGATLKPGIWPKVLREYETEMASGHVSSWPTCK